MTAVDLRQGGARFAGFAVAMAPALAVGLLLRFWRLDEQVMGGDELHAVRLLFQAPLSALLTTYQPNDVSLPLMGLFRGLSDAGVALSEWHFRAPSIVSGVLLLGIVPWTLRARIGSRAALVLGWLLAVSPLLVFYSRFARSYAPIALCVFAATLAFEAWWRTGRRRHGVGFVLLGSLAIYLHPGAGPFVAAPFLYAVLCILRDRRGGREWLRLAALAFGLLAACAVFLIPSRESLLGLLAFQRAVQGRLESGLSFDALWHLAGTRSSFVMAVFWLLALRGGVHLWRADPAWGPLSAAVIVGGVGGIVLLTSGVQPRYVLVALPFVLTWVAVGLTAPLPGRLARWQVPAVVALLVALVATGPLADRRLQGSSFAHHSDFLVLGAPTAAPTPPRVPSFYAGLAGEGPIIEYPWIPSWNAARVAMVAQQVHGHRVRVATPLDWLNDERLALRNVVTAPPEVWAESGAAAIVVHLDLDAEERALAPEWTQLPEVMQNADLRRKQAVRTVKRLERVLGPPDQRSDGIVAWDLARTPEERRSRRGVRP